MASRVTPVVGSVARKAKSLRSRCCWNRRRARSCAVLVENQNPSQRERRGSVVKRTASQNSPSGHQSRLQRGTSNQIGLRRFGSCCNTRCKPLSSGGCSCRIAPALGAVAFRTCCPPRPGGDEPPCPVQASAGVGLQREGNADFPPKQDPAAGQGPRLCR